MISPVIRLKSNPRYSTGQNAAIENRIVSRLTAAMRELARTLKGDELRLVRLRNA